MKCKYCRKEVTKDAVQLIDGIYCFDCAFEFAFSKSFV